ncbi:M15 family metallopeptidase [Candidatus Saccharibacteria bacterium]|nr:M15 family metallopeptidase [Candidatus Saccharibacteria bacterium]
MRRGRVSVLRCVPYAAGLLALLTAGLLAIYFNGKLTPGTEFDQPEQTRSQEAPASVEAAGATTEASAGAENLEQPATMVVDDEIAAEPAAAEETEEQPAVTIMEDEQTEPPIDTDDTAMTVDNDRYRRLFDAAELPNLQALSDSPPVITGDTATDDRIRRIAEGRGYRRRPEPADVSKLVLAEGSFHYLQPEAAQAYWDLRDAMAADGIAVRLTSAYRDYDRQRQIFLGNVASPYADISVFELLKTVSIPGYSKHHTGYAVDLGEGSEFTFHRFAESASYRWLLADDYANARKYGWIPSYPPGVSAQGPNPEPWEFVYVGVEPAAVR